MAGCYHDKQDFKSDLNIEVTREGDLLQAGQDLKDIKCDKNPGHRDFFPFKDLNLEHLPYEYRNREMLDSIKKKGSCVVRLIVETIKNGRWIKEAGSGYVLKIDNEYYIQTNNHVVKTDDEVKHCTVEFHYDDDSRSDVLTSRGYQLVWTCPYRDITFFTFHPVPDFLHQLDIDDCKKIPNIVIIYQNDKIANEITQNFFLYNPSQFHSLQNLNSSLIDFMFILLPDGSYSYLKSFYFKFQTIASNTRQLTSVEIHIDEDYGNSRVIPGDVVNIGDEFVVKISELIFQDEVKKCRVVWNGEVIGRGTRLYFPQVKTSDIFSGIDLEREIKQGRKNYWIYECHPLPRYVEDMLEKKFSSSSSNLCCIGHPHGGFKMVTFGRTFVPLLERFDNQYRHIKQPYPDCQCKEVQCLQYSCKTCPGSSGSPVFPLFNGTDLSHGFSHFMGERVEEYLSSGEPIENINTAWYPSPSC